MECYNQAIKLEKRVPGLYRYRRGVYKDLGNYEEAINDFQKTLESGLPLKVIPGIYFHRGSVYEKLGNYEQAIKDYQVSASRCYGPAIENLLSKGIRPDELGYAVHIFGKITDIYAEAHNTELQGVNETKPIPYVSQFSGRKYIKCYEIGKGLFIAKSFFKECKDLVNIWKVENYELEKVKTLMTKSITYRQKAITLYIVTLNSYPKAGLNFKNKMNETGALKVIAGRYLLDALEIYREFLYDRRKNRDFLDAHIEKVDSFYDSANIDLKDLTRRQ